MSFTKTNSIRTIQGLDLQARTCIRSKGRPSESTDRAAFILSIDNTRTNPREVKRLGLDYLTRLANNRNYSKANAIMTNMIQMLNLLP